MGNDTQIRAVPALALLRFKGADAEKFLQGQLSNDMGALRSDRLLLAGLHNPQGRVLALLRLLAIESSHIVALLPADLAAATLTTLSRCVLRAKVAISEDSTAMAEIAMQLSAVAEALHPDAKARNIAAGVPQVYAATSGEFVAQMLNLDCIDAISFSKGCYTGQEIIARAHYRGRMKRRMQRFATEFSGPLIPGQSVTLSDGRSAQIVDAIVSSGRTEFLAVAPLAAETASPPPAAAPVLDCVQLPLPYALP